MRRLLNFFCLVLVLVFSLSTLPASAQNYSFSLDSMVVDAWWQSDGTLRLEYRMVLTNDPSASPIDFVDIGLPNEYFNLSSAEANVNGRAILHIAHSAYVEHGVELGFGASAIQPGSTGVLEFSISGIKNVLFIDSQDSEYASAVFAPTFFDKQFVHGSTDLTMIFHLPPGVQPEEPRWHRSPSGWPYDEPYPDFDSVGRIVYVWQNTSANGYTQYKFGASFPQKYVPAGTVRTPSVGQQLNIPEELVIPVVICGGFVLFFVLIMAAGIYTARRRKLAYLPPKIAIEGHGIKRGLTAVEAAVLLETPLDRVLTMILFSVIKKGAARVVKEDPLKVERMTPAPKDLRPYEETFLKAMVDETSRKRRRNLQEVMIELVKAVQKKMKGFSLKETRKYYRSIMEKAWQQVEEAETPEVRSQRFDEGLEWTMLDRDFDDRTERTFRTGPVFVPHWWWLYRPSYGGPRPSTTGAAPTARVPSGRGLTIPKLPGSEFAASIVTGVQNAAKDMVSNVVNFTNGVTKTTNPPPPPTTSSRSWSSGGGGSCACACACACAGCACACAGGGR